MNADTGIDLKSPRLSFQRKSGARNSFGSLVPVLTVGLGCGVALAHPIDDLEHLVPSSDIAAEVGINVADCPVADGALDLSRLGASSTSYQWMWGRQFAWNSYRIIASGKGCIELVEPIKEPLTARRAEVLMLLSLDLVLVPDMPEPEGEYLTVNPWGYTGNDNISPPPESVLIPSHPDSDPR